MNAEAGPFSEVEAAAAPRDRYLGGRPFTDTPEDQALFFGRSAEIDSLFHRILAGHLLVLFGKSGLGKTSLLRAGVFPRLREHANLPIEIRVGQAAITRDGPEGQASTFLHLVAAAALDVAKHDPSLDYTPGEGETIWEFFKTAMFWRGDELQTPVLVLDQFEEIFTLMEAGRRSAIAEAIGAACGPMPESVRSRRLLNAATALSEDPPRLKFVLSLREEYFGTLEQLSTDIPKIFLDRFQLLPLSEKQARHAVIMPATLHAFDPKSGASGTFAVRPFTCRDDALADMLTVLQGKAGTVEPFQLQVVCRHIEQIVAAIQATTTQDVVITAKEIGGQAGIQKVIENYYLEQIGTLPRRQRRPARTLCEEGLLTDSGYRLMLEESQIEQDYGLNAAVLARLVDSRLLRQEQRLDSQFYELSHDSLAKAIVAVRPRLRLPRHYKFIAGAILAVAVAALLFGVAQWRAIKQIDEARRRAEAVVSFLNSEDLQDELRRTGRLDVLVPIQQKVQGHFDQFAHSPSANRAASLRDHALALRNMGELLYEAGDTNRARGQFLAAQQILASAIDSDPGSRSDLGRDLAMTRNRLARIAIDQGNLTEAQDFNRKGGLVLEALLERGVQDEAVKASVGEVFFDAGRIHFLQGRFPDALSSTDKAIGALRETLQNEGDSHADPAKVRSGQRRWRGFLISSLRNKAQILEAMGDGPGARQALQEAGALATELSKTGVPDARSMYLVFTLRQEMASLTGAQEDRTRFERAMKWMSSKLEALSEADPDNARRARDVAVVNGIVAGGHVGAGRTDDGLKLYERAASSLQSLAQRDPSNADWQAELSSVKLRWAQALQQRDPDRARELYQAGLKLATKLVEQDRTNVVWSLKLADALSTSIGDGSASQDTQRQRVLIVEDLRSRGALPHTWHDLRPGRAGSFTDTPP